MIYNLTRILSFLLVMAVGVGPVLAVPVMALDVQYGQLNLLYTNQAADVGFAARAPPTAGSNVTDTGGVTSKKGSAFGLHGQETAAAHSTDTAQAIYAGTDPAADGTLSPTEIKNRAELIGALAGYLPPLVANQKYEPELPLI